MGVELGGDSKRVRPVMNITPLVDVVLVLLIIFMVVTPLLTRQFWVSVPKSEESAAPTPAGDDVFASGEVEDYLVEIVPGGGKSEALLPQIKLYPNPANETVQISALLPDDQTPAELVIYNVLGQLVQAPLAVLNNQTTSVNVSMLSPGIYWCALLQNKQTMAVHKMVVVR